MMIRLSIQKDLNVSLRRKKNVKKKNKKEKKPPSPSKNKKVRNLFAAQTLLKLCSSYLHLMMLDGHKQDDEEQSSGQKQDSTSEGSNFFFDPNGGPNPKAILMVLLALNLAYYTVTYKKPMKEIIYMDFLN